MDVASGLLALTGGSTSEKYEMCSDTLNKLERLVLDILCKFMAKYANFLNRN